MDPEKGSILQKIITAVLYVILVIAYFIMKIALRNKKESLTEPKHLQRPPTRPIPSLKLAMALNPKTPLNKLLTITKDDDPYVRRSVVRNPSLPLEAIETLSRDQETIVASEASRVLHERKQFDSRGYELPPV